MIDCCCAHHPFESSRACASLKLHAWNGSHAAFQPHSPATGYKPTMPFFRLLRIVLGSSHSAKSLCENKMFHQCSSWSSQDGSSIWGVCYVFWCVHVSTQPTGSTVRQKEWNLSSDLKMQVKKFPIITKLKLPFRTWNWMNQHKISHFAFDMLRVFCLGSAAANSMYRYDLLSSCITDFNSHVWRARAQTRTEACSFFSDERNEQKTQQPYNETY